MFGLIPITQDSNPLIPITQDSKPGRTPIPTIWTKFHLLVRGIGKHRVILNALRLASLKTFLLGRRFWTLLLLLILILTRCGCWQKTQLFEIMQTTLILSALVLMVVTYVQRVSMIRILRVDVELW